MRWTKDKAFLEIEQATSVDSNNSVILITTNIPWNALPLEFKQQISESNIAGCLKLRNQVNAWAQMNDFDSL